MGRINDGSVFWTHQPCRLSPMEMQCTLVGVIRSGNTVRSAPFLILGPNPWLLFPGPPAQWPDCDIVWVSP